MAFYKATSRPLRRSLLRNRRQCLSLCGLVVAAAFLVGLVFNFVHLATAPLPASFNSHSSTSPLSSSSSLSSSGLGSGVKLSSAQVSPPSSSPLPPLLARHLAQRVADSSMSLVGDEPSVRGTVTTEAESKNVHDYVANAVADPVLRRSKALASFKNSTLKNETPMDTSTTPAPAVRVSNRSVHVEGGALSIRRRELATASTGLCFENISSLPGFYIYDAELGYFRVVGGAVQVPPFVEDWFSNAAISSSDNISVVLNVQQDPAACLVDGVFIPYCGPCASTTNGDTLAVLARDDTLSYQLPQTVATCVVFVTNAFISGAGGNGLDGTCETFCTSNGHSCYRGYRRQVQDSVPAIKLNSQSSGGLTTCQAGSTPYDLFSCEVSTGVKCGSDAKCYPVTGSMKSCVRGVCECPQAYCWNSEAGRCVLQHNSAPDTATVSPVTCERDSLSPCNFDCPQDINMQCLPVTNGSAPLFEDHASADLLDFNRTCQCVAPMCYDESSGTCFTAPEPSTYIDPVVDCSFDFGAVSGDADAGNAICHCEAKQCLVPSNMTGYTGCEAAPTFFAGFANGTAVSHADCSATVECASNYRESCTAGGVIDVACSGATGAEFSFSGCVPACQLPFANEAYDFSCFGEPVIAEDCLFHAATASSVPLSFGECAYSCASGYFNDSQISLHCEVNASATINEFKISGCQPGCSMPIDVASYSLSACPLLAQINGVDYYPQEPGLCSVTCASPAPSPGVVSAECTEAGGVFTLTGCTGFCAFDAARIDGAVYDGSCSTDINGNVDATSIDSACNFTCQLGFSAGPSGTVPFCDTAGFVAVSGCNATETCQIELNSDLFTTYTFSGDCQTGSDTSPSSINLETCNVSCAYGFVSIDSTADGATQLASCNASGWVEINATACLPQCTFSNWITAGSGGGQPPYVLSDAPLAQCGARNGSGAFSLESDCDVACASGYTNITCASFDSGTGDCVVDLSARDSPSKLYQCGALNNDMSQIDLVNTASIVMSFTGVCTVNAYTDGFITLPNMYSTSSLREVDQGNLTAADCALSCATNSSCSAAFLELPSSCASTACDCTNAANYPCFTTSANEGLLQRRVSAESTACTQSCYGKTCDEWLDLSGAEQDTNPYDCDLLETSFECDCSGCFCGGTGTNFQGTTGIVYVKDTAKIVGTLPALACTATYDYFQMSGCAPLAHYFPAGDPVQNSQQTTDCVATFAIDTPAMTGQIVEACDVTCSPATTAASCSFSRNDVLPTYIVEQVGPNAFEAWTSSPICIKTGTCSDGEQSAGEEGVDCGGTCSLACTFIDESFCGIQYNQDGTLASTITVTGSGFSVTRGQSVSAVVFNSFSITTQAAIVTVVSDTELELAFTTFPFSLVGVIGLTYTVTEQTTISFGSFSFTITTVVKTATVDHIATVFANAPTLDSRNSFINSSAQDFTLFGTGFDPAHCSDHDVVLVADCGTVAATASSTCTSNSLLVTISEMSSVSAGKLTARVGIASGPTSEPAVVANITAVAPKVFDTAFADGDPNFDQSVFLSVDENTVYFLNISGRGFDTDPALNDVVVTVSDVDGIVNTLSPCDSSVDVACPWNNWYEASLATSVTRFAITNIPFFLQTEFAGQLLFATVATPDRCSTTPSLTSSPKAGIVFIQSNPVVENSTRVLPWTTPTYNIYGSGFTTGFSVLLVPVACETLFGTSTNCTNQAVCSSTGGFDVGLLETTTTWNSDSCYAFCYNNATCACYKFDAGTRECTAFSSSECSLSTTATRSATSCNMLSPDVFDATGEYRFQSYANASIDIVTMSPALVGHRILVVLTAGTVYYDIAATLTTVADGSPTLRSLNTTIESSVLTLVLEGTGFGDTAANTSIDFTPQLPATVLGQARPIVSGKAETVTFTSLVIRFDTLSARNIGALNATVTVFGLVSNEALVAHVVAGNVSLDSYNVTGLVVPSTAVEFTVTGAGFDSSDVSLNRILYLQIGGDVLDVNAAEFVSLVAVSRDSLTIAFVTSSTQTNVDIILRVAVDIPASQRDLNTPVTTKSTAGLIVAQFTLADPLVALSVSDVTVGDVALRIGGSGFGVGTGPNATNLAVAFEGGVVSGFVLNHTTTIVWVEYTTFNCPDALGPLNVSVSFEANGVVKASAFTQVATVVEGVVEVNGSFPLADIPYSDTSFNILASNFNPRDPTQNQLFLQSPGTPLVEGAIIGFGGNGPRRFQNLLCEFTYIEPFAGTLEAAVSSCKTTPSPSVVVTDAAGTLRPSPAPSKVFVEVANIVPGTWGAVNSSSANVFTNVEYLAVSGFGFSSNLADISALVIDCGVAVVTVNSDASLYPVDIQTNPVFSSGVGLRVAINSLMPSNDGLHLCVLLQLSASRQPFVIDYQDLVVDLGVVQAAAPFLEPFNISGLQFFTNETFLVFQGRGFQDSNSVSSRVDGTLILRLNSTGIEANQSSIATYSAVTVSTFERGLFSPSEQGALEARIALFFNGVDVDPVGTFTHVANIIAAPPTLCGAGTSCPTATNFYLTSDTFDLAGRAFNTEASLNEVEFAVGSTNNLALMNLTDQELSSRLTPLLAQSGKELVPCICSATLDSIRVLWREILLNGSDTCAGVSANTCNGASAPSVILSNNTEIYARVACAASVSCSNVANCSSVRTEWTHVAQMSSSAADLAENKDLLLTNATSLTLLTSSNGNEFIPEATQLVNFTVDNGNPVTARLVVDSVSQATAYFIHLSPNNEGPLYAQIILQADTSGQADRVSENIVQVATLVAATPVVTPSSVELVSNTYFLSINGSGFDPVIPSNNLVSFSPETPPPVVGKVISSTRTGLFVEFSELSVENTGLLRANVQTVVLDSEYTSGGCAASSGTCKTSSSTRVAVVTEGGPNIFDTPEATYTTDDTIIELVGFGFEVAFLNTEVSLWTIDTAANGLKTRVNISTTILAATVKTLTVAVQLERTQLGRVFAEVAITATVTGVVKVLRTKVAVVGTIFLANWCSIADVTTPGIVPPDKLSPGAPNASNLCDVNNTAECINTATGFECICSDSFTGTFCTEPLSVCEANCRSLCTRTVECGFDFWTFNTNGNDGVFTNEIRPFFQSLVDNGSVSVNQPYVSSFVSCMEICVAQNTSSKWYGSSYYDSWISGYYSYVFATRGQSSGASLVGGEMSPVLHLFVVVTVALTM